jgi:predicted RNA binding protein YcfA (HicA-like mRNA interferase family)
VGRAFPSMKARALMALLGRRPLCYEVVRRSGSHRRLRSSAGYPDLTFSFHDGATVPARVVRNVLTKDVGLTEDEALELL